MIFCSTRRNLCNLPDQRMITTPGRQAMHSRHQIKIFVCFTSSQYRAECLPTPQESPGHNKDIFCPPPVQQCRLSLARWARGLMIFVAARSECSADWHLRPGRPDTPRNFRLFRLVLLAVSELWPDPSHTQTDGLSHGGIRELEGLSSGAFPFPFCLFSEPKQ